MKTVDDFSTKSLTFLNFIILLLFLSYTLKFSEKTFYLPLDIVYSCWFFLLLLSFYLTKIKNSFFIFLLLYLFTSFVFYGINSSTFLINTDSSRYLLIIFTFSTLSFNVFSIPKYNNSLYRLTKKINFLFIAIIIFLIIYVVSSKRHFSFFLEQDFINSYLILSDLLSLILIIFLSHSDKKTVFHLLITVVLTIGVLSLGSRSSIVFLLISLTLIFYKNIIKSGFVHTLALLTMLVFSLNIAFYYIQSESEYFYRFYSIVEITEDNSFKARDVIQESFFNKLEKNKECIILGCGYEGQGEYVHNILSIWQSFGLLIFTINLIIIIASFYILFVKKKLGLLLPVYLFCFLSILFSRSYVSIVYPLHLGLSFFILYKGIDINHTNPLKTLSRKP